jgi:prephenate dehydrogenase
MRVALLGLGLIGGSIARAVAAGRTEPSAIALPATASRSAAGPSPDDPVDIELTAWTPSGRGPRAALASGVVSGAPERPEEAIEGADLVVLAAPPLECLGLLESLAGEWRSALGADATVTDVASTKGAIVARAAQLGLPFVGGHPMAGRESSGFAASDAALFAGRPWVVVTGAGAAGRDPERVARDVARVERLARACGARPLRLSADEHDAATAAISHLPLVLSAALVEAVAGEAHRPGRARGGRLAARAPARGGRVGWDDAPRAGRRDDGGRDPRDECGPRRGADPPPPSGPRRVARHPRGPRRTRPRGVERAPAGRRRASRSRPG